MNADPATLRYAAATLRGLADEFCRRAADVDTAARGLAYEGPSANRFREVITASHLGVHAEAATLGRLAARLEDAAVQVEAERRAEAARQAGLT